MAIFLFRYLALWLALAFAALAPYFALQGEGALFWWLVAAGSWALSAIGLRDLTQTHRAILRNYPIIGHLRYLFEDLRPALRQYFFETDTEETPFSRASRSLVYQRAKQEIDKRPFGTQLDVYDQQYEWINHSLAPSKIADSDFRLTVGGPACSQPVSLSVLNISAMSFGALSANAVLALNEGAKLGHFAHDTGEGGISSYHRQPGGDLIWNIQEVRDIQKVALIELAANR